MSKLEQLYSEKSKKFDQVCAVVAHELGYRGLSTLRVEDRIRVEDEAKQCVDLWEETVEMRTSSAIRPITPSTSTKLTPVFGLTGNVPRSADLQRHFRLRAAANGRGAGFSRRLSPR
jgi:hypothetical protein